MIPVNQPLLNGNEKKYLVECIDTGWISSEGPFIKRFEQELSNKVQRKYGIAVCNGSAALDIAVEALEISDGDEVIMPAFTIISCAASVVRAGGIPVLVDSDLLTWNMNIHQIEAKITSRTKAIMVVHIYGLPVDMDHVLLLAKKYNLKIIEDAAEMHGQTYKGKPCGSFGDISIFSFYPNKLLTTGEGGMVVTDDLLLAEKCRSLRNLCFKAEKRFVHDELGWNMRMTNLQAALGVAQLERWDEFIDRKRKMGTLYSQLLGSNSAFQIPEAKTSYAENIYWVFGLRILGEKKAVDITNILGDKGIGTRPFFFPMHLQPVFLKMGLFKDERYPVAEMLYDHGFYIPSGMAITDAEIRKVAETINDIVF